jgi:hypothetical protein
MTGDESLLFDIKAQVHFHAPSEHGVDLGHYESEMHCVFTAAGKRRPHIQLSSISSLAAVTSVLDGSKRTAVVDFFIEVAKHDTTGLLETLFSHLREIRTPVERRLFRISILAPLNQRQMIRATSESLVGTPHS